MKCNKSNFCCLYVERDLNIMGDIVSSLTVEIFPPLSEAGNECYGMQGIFWTATPIATGLDFTSKSGKELIRSFRQPLSKIAQILPPKQGITAAIVADEGEEQVRGGKQQC